MVMDDVIYRTKKCAILAEVSGVYFGKLVV